MKVEEFYKIWAQINVKAWQDKKFKERLLKNPRETLKEFGIDLPDRFKEIKIQDAPKVDVLHLTLLPPPPMKGVSEKELEGAVGGWICAPIGSCV